MPGALRSHAALHLAVALRCGAERMLSYDDELAVAASLACLESIRPA